MKRRPQRRALPNIRSAGAEEKLSYPWGPEILASIPRQGHVPAPLAFSEAEASAGVSFPVCLLRLPDVVQAAGQCRKATLPPVSAPDGDAQQEPKSAGVAQWEKVQFLVEHGFRFYPVYTRVESGVKYLVRYPMTLAEAKNFVVAFREQARFPAATGLV